MFRTFLKRHEDSQDGTKITAIPTTTFELLQNTEDNLIGNSKQITSVNDKSRNDINDIIELKSELKTAIKDFITIISEFTFLFFLDNIEHVNDKRIEFGEIF